MYDELKKIQRLIFKDDDMMNQETLFELQDAIAELTFNIAKKEGKAHDLLMSFPYIYKCSEGK